MAIREAKFHLLDRLAAGGVTVRIHEGPAGFLAANRKADRGEVCPMMGTGQWRRGGLWFEGLDSAGQFCHLQAARPVDPRPISLAAHLADRLGLYAPPDLVGRARDQAKSQVSKDLRGPICYHGEMWLRPDLRGRDRGAALIHLLILESFLRFDFGLLFGITMPHTSNEAFAIKMGYAGFEAGVFEWQDRDRQPLKTEGLVWSLAADMPALAARAERLSEKIDGHGAGDLDETG